MLIIYLFVRFITHLHSGETQASQPDLMEFYQYKRDQHQAYSIRIYLYCLHCENGCGLIRVWVPLCFSAEEGNMVSTWRITKQATWECITQPDLHSASHKQWSASRLSPCNTIWTVQLIYNSSQQALIYTSVKFSKVPGRQSFKQQSQNILFLIW